jgi:hypothetical protein
MKIKTNNFVDKSGQYQYCYAVEQSLHLNQIFQACFRRDVDHEVSNESFVLIDSYFVALLEVNYSKQQDEEEFELGICGKKMLKVVKIFLI